MMGIPDGYIVLNYDRIIEEREGLSLYVDFGYKRAWLPWSTVDTWFEDGEGKQIVLTRSIAKKKGLI